MYNTTAQTLRFLQSENQRLQEENESLREEVSTLREFVKVLRDLSRSIQTVSTEQSPASLLRKILYAALKVLDAADGSMILLDEDGDELVFEVVLGEAQDRLQGYRIPADTGIAGWVLSTGEPQIVNRPRLDSRFFAAVDETFQFRTISLIAVPLIARGKAIGVVEVLNKFNEEDFTEVDLNMLSILAFIAANILEAMRYRKISV